MEHSTEVLPEEVKLYIRQLKKCGPLQNREKEFFKSEEGIHRLSVAVTHLAFRNGPIEGVHADPKSLLTDEKMKTLNKYMVNVLAYIFGLIVNDDWGKLRYIVERMRLYGRQWDKAVPDDLGFDQLYEWFVESILEQERQAIGNTLEESNDLGVV